MKKKKNDFINWKFLITSQKGPDEREREREREKERKRVLINFLVCVNDYLSTQLIMYHNSLSWNNIIIAKCTI